MQQRSHVRTTLSPLFVKRRYQRAIFLSPLSLTIPYLAFTPAILILTGAHTQMTLQ